MINLCTSPSLTTKQLLDIISTDLIRLLCYCFLEFYWLLGDKSLALKIILWPYITLCANFQITELQVRGHFSADPRFSMQGGQTHAAVDPEGDVGIFSFSCEMLISPCCREKMLANVLQQVNKMKKLRTVLQPAPTHHGQRKENTTSECHVRSSLRERKTEISEWPWKPGV